MNPRKSALIAFFFSLTVLRRLLHLGLGSSFRFRERLVAVEELVNLCHLDQRPYLLVQAYEHDFPVCFAPANVSADECAESSRIDKRHATKVHNHDRRGLGPHGLLKFEKRVNAKRTFERKDCLTSRALGHSYLQVFQYHSAGILTDRGPKQY